MMIKVLSVLFIVATLSGRCSPQLVGVCESCFCAPKPNQTHILHVNCSSTPKFEKIVDFKSNNFKEVHLAMDNMKLSTIQRYTKFESLNVTSLSLNYNNIKSIPSFVFSKFTNLSSLSLVENEIEKLSQESFGGLLNLKVLNLSYNAIQSFDTAYLHDLNQLTTVDLRGNSLLKFESTSTLPVMRIRQLDLSQNKLTTFPTNALKILKELLYLNLSNNQIGMIPKDAFEMQNVLENLYFSHNRIRDIDLQAFPNVNVLKILDLNHNLISSTDFISKLKLLTWLNIGFNSITSISTVSWSLNLNELIISRNGITSLDEILNGLPQLKKLDASWNQLSKIPIINNSNLKHLVLDANGISSLTSRPTGNGALTYLSLSEIPHLTVLKKDSLNGIFAVNTTNSPCAKLEISRTNLLTIEKGALNTLNICELNLRWNKLTELPEDTFNWYAIKKIDLQDNPWHCSCSMQWLLDKVVGNMYASHQDILEDLRCQTPKNLEGIRLVHWYNKTEPMLCKKDTFRIANFITISSSPGMIILVVVLGLIAVALVATGFYLQRKQVRARRSRKNRRF